MASLADATRVDVSSGLSGQKNKQPLLGRVGVVAEEIRGGAEWRQEEPLCVPAQARLLSDQFSPRPCLLTSAPLRDPALR